MSNITVHDLERIRPAHGNNRKPVCTKWSNERGQIPRTHIQTSLIEGDEEVQGRIATRAPERFRHMISERRNCGVLDSDMVQRLQVVD